MKRLLLDTSAYFAFMRGHREAGYAIADAEEVYLNVVVVGELFEGFLHGRKREQNRAEFDRFVMSPRVQFDSDFTRVPQVITRLLS